MKKRTRRSLISVLLVLVLSLSMMTPIFATSVEGIAAETDDEAGYIYSEWYGGVYLSWSANANEWIDLGSFICDAIFFSNIAWDPAVAIGAEIASRALSQLKNLNLTPQYEWGVIRKDYREVRWSDGSLAFYEIRYMPTETWFQMSNGSKYSIPNIPTKIYTSLYPMSPAC